MYTVCGLCLQYWLMHCFNLIREIIKLTEGGSNVCSRCYRCTKTFVTYLLHLFDCVSKMLRIANWKLLPLHNKISSRRTFCFSFWLYTQLEKMQQGFFLRDGSVQVQDLLTGWKMTTNLSGNYLIKKIILQENFTFNEQ